MNKQSKSYNSHRVATLHRATLNRPTVKQRHFNGRQLTGATINRSDRWQRDS